MEPDELETRLAGLLAVTDVQLTKLDIDDLLDEVLDRVRMILEADTAAVLLHEGPDLVARAAHGIEEEVRQGVRVPVGVGFAGRIAARREPVILDRVDPTTVANPILWEKGIQRMLGVPLIFGDALLGVLHVGRLNDVSFTEHDVHMLQVAAERVAAAIHARQSAVEAAAATMLERGLLPTRLPQVPGLQFAARYAPGEDRSVGGDWYDVFSVPSGELWVVIGDVAGHGLATAVIVARVKSALRAYALVGRGPSDVLAMTNRKLKHFEVDTIVTAQCAVARQPYERFEISSAGHPAPVLANGDDAAFVSLSPGPPLGAFDNAEYPLSAFDLPIGGTALFFTDGLIERREVTMEASLARLLDVVRESNPDVLCREVMHSMVGAHATSDDVAVLAMHRAHAIAAQADPPRPESASVPAVG